MKAPSLLLAALSRAVSDADDTCHHCRGRRHRRSARTPPPRQRSAFECGGEPCDAVLRGLARVSRPDAGRAWRETAGRAPTATCRPTASSSRPPASRRDSSSFSGGAAGIRMPTIRCFGPSMRTISGPTATPPAISAIFARTVSSGSRSRCRRPSGSIDPATNAVSNETFVDVWRMVPTVNDVALTGPDASIPVWPRDPNPTGGYQLDARVTTLQEQALGALVNHAQIQTAPPQQLLDDLSSFQRVLFTNHRVRALSDAVRRGFDAAAGSGSAAQRSRTAGQGRVRASVQPVPRRSRAVDPGVSGESIQHHLEPVSASCGHRDAGSLRVRGVSAAARPQRADLRDRAVSSDAGPDGHHSRRDQGAPHELRSRPCAADRVRRRPRPRRRLGQIRRARTARDSARPPRTSTTTAPPRSKTWSITMCSSSSGSRRSRRRVSSRRPRRPTACISIACRVPKSVRRCSRTCENSRRVERPMSSDRRLPPSRPAPRDAPRWFYVWMAGACVLIAFVGFAPTYWLQLRAGHVRRLAAPASARGCCSRRGRSSFSCKRRSRPGGRVDRHRAWGLLGISLATAMVLVGFAVANEVLATRLAAGFGDRARAFHIASTSMITLFGVFVFAAIVYVRRPEIHKRLMLLATVSMLPPAIARLFFAVSVGMGPGLRPGLGPPRTVESVLIPALLADALDPRGRDLRRAHARPAPSRVPHRWRHHRSPSRFCACP